MSEKQSGIRKVIAVEARPVCIPAGLPAPDSVPLEPGDLVLLIGQVEPSENGVYEWTKGGYLRMSVDDKKIRVERGDVCAETKWIQTAGTLTKWDRLLAVETVTPKSDACPRLALLTGVRVS